MNEQNRTGQTAATGNPLIPANPDMAALRASAGAQGSPQASPQAPAASPDAGDTGIDWLGLFDTPQVQQQPQAQTQQPSGQSPNGQVAQAQPEQLPVEQRLAIAEAQQAAPPAQPQAQQPQMSTEQMVSAAQAQLLQTTYKLNDEQKRQLVSEPDVAIPQLAAQMHVSILREVATYMSQVIQQHVPQLALGAMKRELGAVKAEQAFFGAYPALNRPEFRSVVLQSLKYAQQMNPRATRDQIMKEGAELASYKLRLNSQQNQQQPSQRNGSQPPHTPAQAPAQQLMHQPFMPAIGGAPAQSNMPGSEPPNIFEQLAQDPNW